MMRDYGAAQNPGGNESTRLWRKGKIPEWIDITPYEVSGGFLYSD